MNTRFPSWYWLFLAVWVGVAGGVVVWGRRVMSAPVPQATSTGTDRPVSAPEAWERAPADAPSAAPRARDIRPESPAPEPPIVEIPKLEAPVELEPMESAPPVEETAAVRPRRLPVSAFSLVIPVAGVAPDDLSDTFTDARSGGRSHDAIDIHAPQGTPVIAATDGEIARLFESELGGLTIYQVADDDSTVLYYAHLDAYAPGLGEGDEVAQGTVIGYVGDTGNAAPGSYHLHFALWTTDDPDDFWDGDSINPYSLLVR